MSIETMADITPMTAQELDDEIRATAADVADSLGNLATLMERAKADELFYGALGFDSWMAYVADVFAAIAPTLGSATRVTGMQLMASAGMSTRAIGTAFDVDQSTVVRQLMHNASPDLPAEVAGLDGKTYPRPIPKPPKVAECKACRAVYGLDRINKLTGLCDECQRNASADDVIDAVLVDDPPLTEAECRALDGGPEPEVVKVRKSALTAEVKAIAVDLDSVVTALAAVAADKRYKGAAQLMPMRAGIDRLDAVLTEIGYYDYVRTLAE